MTNPAWFWLTVNWISLPIMAVLGGILAKRKLHREFPFFFFYVVVTVAASAIRVVAQFSTPLVYFYAYWITDLVIAVLAFLSVYELVVRRVFPGFYKVRVYRHLFAGASAAIIVFAWLTAIEAPNKAAAFAIEERVLDSILVGILVFFVLLMMVMGRTWKRYDLGIAFGFAIYTAAFLVASAFWVRAHYRPTAVDELPVIAYDISSLVWLYCFWSGEKPASGLPESAAPELLRQARTWETVLKKWLGSKKNVV